jgi:hypothetical protein
MKELRIFLKKYTKEYLSEHSDMVFHNRELIIESDESSVGDPVLRFKIGDGMTPYKQLKYVSSIYSLFPTFAICDASYNHEIILNLDGDSVVQGK